MADHGGALKIEARRKGRVPQGNHSRLHVFPGARPAAPGIAHASVFHRPHGVALGGQRSGEGANMIESIGV
jgi:hypothetical protein